MPVCRVSTDLGDSVPLRIRDALRSSCVVSRSFCVRLLFVVVLTSSTLSCRHAETPPDVVRRQLLSQSVFYCSADAILIPKTFHHFSYNSVKPCPTPGGRLSRSQPHNGASQGRERSCRRIPSRQKLPRYSPVAWQSGILFRFR